MKHSINPPALLLAIAGLITLYSCEKDEVPKPFITAQAAVLGQTDVNCCELNNGKIGTRFHYSIPYEASEGIQITKMEYKETWSSGIKTSGEFSTADGSDGTVNRRATVIFNSDSWLEYSLTLVSSTGIKSNPIVIRFNKPAGAN